MSRLTSFFLLAICLGAAHANEEIARRVQGNWLITTPENLRTWVLEVKKHKQDQPGRVEFYGYYGPTGERFPTALDVVYSTDVPVPTFTASIGGTRIEAKQEAENLFSGSIITSRGSYPVRLERLGEDEIGKRRLNIPPLHKGAKLEFIYLSTNDCPYCAQWESRSKGELLASPEGKAVRFVEVKGDTLRLPILEKHFPEEHKWVSKQIGPSRGVPRFLLAIDGKIMLNAFGTGGYSDVFLPALRQVIARRDAGS